MTFAPHAAVVVFVAACAGGSHGSETATSSPSGDGGMDVAAARRSQPSSPSGPAPAIAHDGEWRIATVVVRGSIAGSLAPAIPAAGSVLAAHYARIFMWDLDLRRDVLPGDEMTVVWREQSGEIEIGAASHLMRAQGRRLRAYRYQAADDAHASYWDESGHEIARRLKASPLREYDQITALLRDRASHRGMDFKAPTGTPVYAPRPGVVTRVNWKTRGNGNCLELRFADGALAKFLHLSAVKVKPGARVSPGQVIALTGNTGRSTAPHLHYQIEHGKRVLDPLTYHGTTRRKLDGAALKAFQSETKRLAALLERAEAQEGTLGGDASVGSGQGR